MYKTYPRGILKKGGQRRPTKSLSLFVMSRHVHWPYHLIWRDAEKYTAMSANDIHPSLLRRKCRSAPAR